eukprot:CAMPEP_0119021714 /NCGR_PEP_ID=MMETSP1176-20130426/26561_1 /TAXON_ID=265551 /ORGANISM="Synedropsis recta cf, Strain CCMP1620" /LENGTH=143 /DNA_ID=CAMNT_0006976395 /DNA_START=10 /DNA_END=441 /DNA_ORIENTATION=+
MSNFAQESPATASSNNKSYGEISTRNQESASSLLSVASFGCSFTSVMAVTPIDDDDGSSCGFSCRDQDTIEALLAGLAEKYRENRTITTTDTYPGDDDEILNSLIAALGEIDYCKEEREEDILGFGHDSINITKARRSLQSEK